MWLQEPSKPIAGQYSAYCARTFAMGVDLCSKRRITPMTTPKSQNLDATPTWISAILWLGVAIVVISFLALIGVLVYYFTGTTPATWLFWLALLAFPTGFILMLVALVGNVYVRRKRQRA